MSENAPVVSLRTNLGSIRIRLFPDQAPVSVSNFLTYVQDGFYNGTIFHRVIPGFMIQGGGFTPDMRQKTPHEPICNEARNGLANRRGTVAMARTGEIDSATCQFFINVADNEMLNHQGMAPSQFGYAVFGEVVEGMEVVDQISRLATGNWGYHRDVPQDTVEIRAATLTEGNS